MGMPSRQPHSWTYEKVLALIDEQEDRSIRYEFADGDLLVTPAPGGYHQRIILALYDLLHPYVHAHRLGEIRLGPSPVRLVEKTIFQPDFYIVPSVEGR
jgi:Uma2 family endonuclease